MSWMTKHTKNLLGDMPIDNKASALNHNSFPVEHPQKKVQTLQEFTKTRRRR